MNESPRAPDPPDSEANPPETDRRAPALLLKGAAVLTVALGLGLLAWLVDKALRHPEVRATQLDAVAPFWVPFMIFIAGGVALIAGLFWRAAGRVDDGEDLFAGRHRRRPGEEE